MGRPRYDVIFICDVASEVSKTCGILHRDIMSYPKLLSCIVRYQCVDGQCLIYVAPHHCRLPTNIGRELVAKLLNTPDKANWQSCVVAPDEEFQLANSMQKRFFAFEKLLAPEEELNGELRTVVELLRQSEFGGEGISDDSSPSQVASLGGNGGGGNSFSFSTSSSGGVGSSTENSRWLKNRRKSLISRLRGAVDRKSGSSGGPVSPPHSAASSADSSDACSDSRNRHIAPLSNLTAAGHDTDFGGSSPPSAERGFAGQPDNGEGRWYGEGDEDSHGEMSISRKQKFGAVNSPPGFSQSFLRTKVNNDSNENGHFDFPVNVLERRITQ